MRFVLPFVGVLACACLACGAALAPQSNSAKLGEAAAFAAAAGALQMAQAAMEQHARNNAPITHAGGVGVTPQCNNEGQYGCVSVSSSPMTPDAPEPELNDD